MAQTTEPDQEQSCSRGGDTGEVTKTVAVREGLITRPDCGGSHQATTAAAPTPDQSNDPPAVSMEAP